MARTILTVDDSASIRQLVAATLTHAGYLVIEASDGVDGIEKACSRRVDLILTDQNMPRMDGVSLIVRLRALAEHRATPIFMLTSESSKDVKSKGRAAGATGWLSKPIDPDKLVELVARALA